MRSEAEIPCRAIGPRPVRFDWRMLEELPGMTGEAIVFAVVREVDILPSRPRRALNPGPLRGIGTGRCLRLSRVKI
jgi:hypothetical protein